MDMNDKIKQILTNIEGVPKAEQNKYLLLYHIVAINTMIIELINQASLNDIDLKELNISSTSTFGISLSSRNIPMLPLFKIDSDIIKSVTEVCSDDVIYPDIINEQFKRF